MIAKTKLAFLERKGIIDRAQSCIYRRTKYTKLQLYQNFNFKMMIRDAVVSQKCMTVIFVEGHWKRVNRDHL